MGELQLVTSETPLRVSFFGGGTDLPSHYRESTGHVVSMAIQQHIYVTVKRHSSLFEEQFRLSYYESEHVSRVEDIQNDVARGCLELLEIDFPLHISIAADVPAKSGLGSSSSFAVGLLNALHAICGQSVSAGQLAEEACKVELDLLGKRMGKQDQYAAAFGGLNHFTFHPDDRVSVDPISRDHAKSLPLKNLFLVWTGFQRRAEAILEEQDRNNLKNSADLKALGALALSFKRNLIEGKAGVDALGYSLSRSWEIKRRLASSIAFQELDEVYSKIMRAGAAGAKLLGAGGGGFFLACVPDAKVDSFESNLPSLKVLSVAADPIGSRVITRVAALDTSERQ